METKAWKQKIREREAGKIKVLITTLHFDGYVLLQNSFNRYVHLHFHLLDDLLLFHDLLFHHLSMRHKVEKTSEADARFFFHRTRRKILRCAEHSVLVCTHQNLLMSQIILSYSFWQGPSQR